jgi:putative nucleotidyltransferase with HDIG domain
LRSSCSTGETKRGEQGGRLAMNPNLQRYLKGIGDLPPMPDIAARVLRAVDGGECSVNDLRLIIERDPAIVARILKVANSALYGFARQIDTLTHALALLGMQTVKNLVLAASMRQVFARFGLMEKLLFEHASLCGPVAHRLARHLPGKWNPEEAFVAGLLHDMGKIVLANSYRDEYEQVVARGYNQNLGFAEVERASFGFDHAELGAEVARHWQLAPLLESVIRYHHEPARFAELDPDHRRMTALIAVASSSLSKLGIGRKGPADVVDPMSLGAWEELGLGQPDVADVLALCAEEAERARAMVD